MEQVGAPPIDQNKVDAKNALTDADEISGRASQLSRP
jgi:hypothetical protein